MGDEGDVFSALRIVSTSRQMSRQQTTRLHVVMMHDQWLERMIIRYVYDQKSHRLCYFVEKLSEHIVVPPFKIRRQGTHPIKEVDMMAHARQHGQKMPKNETRIDSKYDKERKQR